ncbi:MerR family transcriptional regulator [Nocardia flavorosea]|uniref:MerR family transcriptional regulator n=1 Tax=Nocardia flavorosea TaxID=53429 RepID=A0A846Y8Q7_9NOCA|nr:MerR family transcriptional regulator [Nocardia flavorosea]NKY55946.1 MerR family transcriptional regulator [Nocardia flavorosea]
MCRAYLVEGCADTQTPDQVRVGEEQRLLTADRTPGGHRDYPERAVDRVIHIQELFAAGLCSKKIVQILPCLRDTDGGANESATPDLVGELEVERDRINRMIADLVRSREVLDEVIERAGASFAPVPV